VATRSVTRRDTPKAMWLQLNSTARSLSCRCPRAEIGATIPSARDQIASVVRRRYMANLLAQALPRLSAEQVGRYLPDFEVREYEAGSVIIAQGGPADTFFIITKGLVEVINTHPSGQDVLLGELGAGECFGEIGLLAARPRMATVRTKPDAPVELMALGREAFSKLIADSSATREELAVIMSKRILAMTHPQSTFGHS